MKKLNEQAIKSCELNILLKFAEFCRAHRLVYYLAGGTLLGAIRHKGFIPWDDDIDICMPRADYETFLSMSDEFIKQYDSLAVKSNFLGNMNAPYAKIIDKNTVIDSKYIENDFDLNLWIDIFPVDGLPKDTAEVEHIYKKCDFYRRILFLNYAKLGEGKTAFRTYAKYILKPIAQLYGKKRCVDNIEKLAVQNKYEESEYVGVVTGGLLGAGQRMRKSEFEQSVDVEFEGHIFPAFSCWDGYLTGMYGDYMTLPPVDKRATHAMTAYLLEK